MKNLIIFGDSYSTFKDYVPEGYSIYYPKLDVDEVNKTWWKLFISKTGYNLIHNNSWSGSTIGYTGYNNYDCSKTSSFICRYKKQKNNGLFNNDIDLVIVFGGANDSWADSPLGEIKFSDWTEDDLYSVFPAISYLLYNLREDLPKSKILCVINTDLKEEIVNCMIESSNKFSIDYVVLHDIDKINGHPTALGMNQICNQIIDNLK